MSGAGDSKPGINQTIRPPHHRKKELPQGYCTRGATAAKNTDNIRHVGSYKRPSAPIYQHEISHAVQEVVAPEAFPMQDLQHGRPGLTPQDLGDPGNTPEGQGKGRPLDSIPEKGAGDKI